MNKKIIFSLAAVVVLGGIAAGVYFSGILNEPEPDPNAPPRMERLDPSERVRADVAKFQRETLDPSMAPALASDEWDAFVQNMFKLRGWRRGAEGREHIDAVREVEEAYAAYVANREEMRARRAAEEEAAKGKEAAKDEVA